MCGYILVDGVFEALDRTEDASANALVRDVAEETFDYIQPRTTCRSEMDVELGMATDPRFHLGMLMGGVIVTDQVDFLIRG